jgi:hypothetical protein
MVAVATSIPREEGFMCLLGVKLAVGCDMAAWIDSFEMPWIDSFEMPFSRRRWLQNNISGSAVPHSYGAITHSYMDNKTGNRPSRMLFRLLRSGPAFGLGTTLKDSSFPNLGRIISDRKSMWAAYRPEASSRA